MRSQGWALLPLINLSLDAVCVERLTDGLQRVEGEEQLSRYQEEFETEREDLSLKADSAEKENQRLRTQVKDLKAKIVRAA